MNQNNAIEITDSSIPVDASFIADSLNLTPAAVQAGMRDGTITCRCERGVGDDAGRHRLTFFHGSRRLRLVVDDLGAIIQHSIVDFGPLGIPPSARRPSA